MGFTLFDQHRFVNSDIALCCGKRSVLGKFIECVMLDALNDGDSVQLIETTDISSDYIDETRLVVVDLDKIGNNLEVDSLIEELDDMYDCPFFFFSEHATEFNILYANTAIVIFDETTVDDYPVLLLNVMSVLTQDTQEYYAAFLPEGMDVFKRNI